MMVCVRKNDPLHWRCMGEALIGWMLAGDVLPRLVSDFSTQNKECALDSSDPVRNHTCLVSSIKDSGLTLDAGT